MELISGKPIKVSIPKKKNGNQRHGICKMLPNAYPDAASKSNLDFSESK